MGHGAEEGGGVGDRLGSVLPADGGWQGTEGFLRKDGSGGRAVRGSHGLLPRALGWKASA